MVRMLMKKYKFLLIIQFFIVLFLFFGCFREEKIIFSEEDVMINDNNDEKSFLGMEFKLAPGIYQLQAKTSNMEKGYSYITVNADDHSFRTFRCNGAVLYAHQENLIFEVYALENIDSAFVNCVFSDDMIGKIDSIEMRYSNKTMYMLLFLFISICILLDFLLAFRMGIKNKSINKEKQIVFWGLLLSVFIAFYPYLTNYFSFAADIAFHWLRIEGLKETLLNANQFPVRIQSHWLYDHGYAVSTFYGDLFLFIPVFFRLIGLSLMNAYKMFVFVVTVATAGISYYSFKRCTKNIYAALFGSVIYMLSPYRIYNFYNRGAVGEFLAMTFLPLVICGMYALYTEDVKSKDYLKAKIPLIVGLSCILQSHLLSCEMTILFILAICIVFWKKTLRKETFIQLLQSAIVCLLINAWFWVPLLKMLFSDTYYLGNIISKDIQYMGTWLAEIFQLFPNMGTAQNGMYMAEPFQMGISCLSMLVISLSIIIKRQIRKKQELHVNSYDGSVLFFSVMVVVFWFMSTRYFPWDFLAKIPGIQIFATAIQFPTRLFVFVSVFSAIQASFFFLWIREECKNQKISENKVFFNSLIFVLLLLTLGTAVYHVNDISIRSTPVWLYNGENMGSISVVNGEYLLEESVLENYSHQMPIVSEGLEYEQYHKNGTSIDLSIKNTLSSETYIELPLIGYKGYGLAFSEAKEVPYITEKRGENGNLRIAIPPKYEGDLSVSYKGFLSYRIAEFISLVTMLCIVICGIKRSRDKWKKRDLR